jgi:hypothetical protein
MQGFRESLPQKREILQALSQESRNQALFHEDLYQGLQEEREEVQTNAQEDDDPQMRDKKIRSNFQEVVPKETTRKKGSREEGTRKETTREEDNLEEDEHCQILSNRVQTLLHAVGSQGGQALRN